jgi:predicted lipoprotein with Yx(FWY)xxD motif
MHLLCDKNIYLIRTLTPPFTTPEVAFQLKTDSHFGSIIADGNGNTPYFISLDADGKSACTGSCLAVWPVTFSVNTAIGAGLTASGFSRITRSERARQSTYKAAGTGATLYMTDDHRVTLYSFSSDKSGKNSYTISDFSNDAVWPTVLIDMVQNVPSVLDKSAFSSISVFTKPQLTNMRWPVYRFGPDSGTRGNTKGVSIATPGTWRLWIR